MSGGKGRGDASCGHSGNEGGTAVKQNGRRRKRSLAAAFLNLVSIFVLVLLLAVCLPLTVPRLFGYRIYSVVSGSMEPAIPTGSLVYIREGEPEDAAEGDVIAFYGAADSGSIITHRVVENRVVMGEFITKGDANQSPDMKPVPYSNFIGQVERSIPEAGKIAEVFTSREGKILAGCAVATALLLQLGASLLEGHRRKREN